MFSLADVYLPIYGQSIELLLVITWFIDIVIYNVTAIAKGDWSYKPH